MLKCCESDGETYLFLSFFAVGKSFRALLCHAVKGGVSCQKTIFCNFQGSKRVIFFTRGFHNSLYTTLQRFILLIISYYIGLLSQLLVPMVITYI